MPPTHSCAGASGSQEVPLSVYPTAWTPTRALQKRNVDRACDACRRRKKGCDGPQMPNNCCSSCLQSDKLCTYMEPSKPRGPPKAYVTGLENKKERLEYLLERLCPGVDFSDELGPPVFRDSWKTEQPMNQHNLKTPLHLLPELMLSSADRMEPERYRHFDGYDSEVADSDNSSDKNCHYTPSNSEAMARSSTTALTLGGETERVYSVDVVEGPKTVRFHGKTGLCGFVDATRKYRQMLLKQSGGPSVHVPMDRTPGGELLCRHRRPQYWRSPKWEVTWEGNPLDWQDFLVHVLAQFPPAELARSLVDLFFEYTNILFPFLHRPTFEHQFEDKLYKRDMWFACVCNLVFAIASRFSNDPRVVPPNAKTPNGDVDWCKAGWDYFNMGMDIHRVRRSLFLPATLLEVQAFTLISWFLRSTSAYPVAWSITAIALRKAQDVGAHRKKMYREKPRTDGELWKRTFWILVILDIFSALTLGRSFCINQEDYDVDLPLEVDDEYWEMSNPVEAFKQPRGVPSKLSAFNYCVKMGWILGFTYKTLYAIDKSASFVAKTRSRAEQILKDIETALDEWLRSLPEHLRWSHDLEDSVFTSQAALLHLLYRVAQIVLYRPFTTRPSDSSAAQKQQGFSDSCSVKALALCTASARSIVRIVESQKTGKIAGTSVEFYASYYAAGQLLLRIWDLKVQVKGRKGKQDKSNILNLLGNEVRNEDTLSLTQEIDELVGDVHVVMSLYEKVQARWEFVQPILERLKESLPKDGEMVQPDIWYPATAKYFGFDEVPGQDVSSVPNGSEGTPYLSETHHQRLYPSLYSTVVSDFLPPSPHAPLEKPSQETINDFFPELSTRWTDQTFAGAPLPPQFDTNQAGFYHVPQESANPRADQRWI